MYIYKEMDFKDFEAWSGGEYTQEVILRNNKEDQFETYISELFPDGITEEELNDELRYNDKEIYKYLQLSEEDIEEESVEDYIERYDPRMYKYKYDYIAMDQTGSWFVFRDKPTLNEEKGLWECDESAIPMYISGIKRAEDWKQSLRKLGD